MPATPAVPNTTDSAQLALARQKLGCFDSAVLNFSAATVGGAPASVTHVVGAPPNAFATATSVLDAWGFSATCDSGTPRSGTPLGGALKHAAQCASASRDLKGVLAQWLALLRLQQAIGNGSISADAGTNSEMTDALAEATAAAIAHAGSDDAVQSLDNLRSAMACLLQIDQIRQQLGIAADPQLTAALRGLLQRFTTSFTENLGVIPGVYSPRSTQIESMNRFTALDNMRQLIGTLAIAQQLGLDGDINAPIDETMGQLALRVWDLLGDNLLQAEAAGDYTGFTYALEDALEFIGLVQSGVFPQDPALASLPGASVLDSFGTRLAEVMQADLSKPDGERSLGNQKQELRRLLAILRELPSGITYPPAAIQRACDRLESTLTNTFNTLSLYPMSDLNVMLEAGILHAELRDRFGLAARVSWETNRLPALVQRIGLVGEEQNAWSELHDAVVILLAEADRQGAAGDQVRQQLYLAKAGELLTISRTVAVALWQDDETRRGANPLLQIADMILPGDVLVDRVAGAVSYDRAKRFLEGSFSGEMRLPKFNLSLTVENASFNSGGAFDLTAYGSLGLPDGAPTVTLSIPARRPLKVSYRPPNQVSFASGARLALNNGMAFEGFVSLIDPVYSFGIAAEGIRFDMATNAVVFIPTFPNATNFNASIAQTLNEYYQGLSASLDSLSSLTNGVAMGVPGTPPDFADTTLAIPGDSLVAWANGILVDLTNNVVRDYSATTNTIKAQLTQLAESLRRQRDQLEQSEVYLRGVALRRMCAAIGAKQFKAGQQGASTADMDAIRNAPEFRDYAVAAEDAAARLMTRPDSTITGNRPSVLRATASVMAGLQCADATDLFNSLNAVTQDYLPRSLAASMDDLGLDPATGRPKPGANVFTNLSPERVFLGLTNLFAAKEYFQDLGYVEPGIEATARQSLAIRYRELMISKLASLSITNAADHAQIGQTTFQLLLLHNGFQRGLFDYPSTPILQIDGSLQVTDGNSSQELNINYMSKISQAADYLENGGNEATRFFSSLPKKQRDDLFGLKQLAAANARLLQPVIPPNSPLTRLLNKAFAKQLADVENRVQSPWTSERMAEGVRLLDELSQLALWAKNYSPADLTTLSNLVVGNLTVNMIGSARAKRNAWLLNRYIQLALDAAATKINNDSNALEGAFLQATDSSLKACGDIVQDLKSLLPAQRPFDLKLPGGLLVRRAAGTVTYNRLTRVVQGTFSGRLEFPDLDNAFFEISDASLDSLLSFSIAATTGGPLPLDGVRVTASLLATGGVNQPFFINGSGTMSVKNGPDFAVNLTYDQNAKALSFDSSARNLDLRFTDDAVLFDAGFGFTLKPEVQAGQLRADATAGFFAKGPLGSTPSRTNFYLLADSVSAVVNFQPGSADLLFTNGTLRLPEFFNPGLCPSGGGGASISLTSTNPVSAHFVEDDGTGQPSISFGGQLNFKNIGFKVPQIDGLGAELCSATLLFTNRDLPFFTNINGTLSIPLPPGQTSRVDILNASWKVDGFPIGKIALRNDVKLLDFGGASFTLLGLGNTNCPAGNALTVLPPNGGELPRFVLDGGMELRLPTDMVTGATGDVIRAIACGSLTVAPPALPDLQISTLGFGGTFHIGGQDGLLVTNALVSLQGIENVFVLSESKPFIAGLTGTLKVPDGPSFTLNGARFIFFDPQRLPRFEVQGIGFDASQFSLMQVLPARVNSALLQFKNPSLDLPDLLNPTNITLTMSAAVSIPPTNAIIAGRVDNIKISSPSNGVLQIEGLSGLGFEIGGVTIPPLEEIGGRLYIGGLSPDPSKMYFAGRVAGSYQGYKLKMLMAFNLAGPIGLCLDVNAGAIGIPVGQTGILISGASGGVSFLNKNADPCDFTAYMTTNGAPLPTMINLPGALSWDSLREAADRMARAVEAFAGSSQAAVPAAFEIDPATEPLIASLDPSSPQESERTPELPPLAPLGGGLDPTFQCPGDCPPATVNIFCQPHPDQTNYSGRIILKFSSIDEPTLNSLGITAQSVASLGADASVVSQNVAANLRAYLDSLQAPFSSSIPQSKRDAIQAIVTETLDAAESEFRELLANVLSTNNASQFYALIRDKAYEGIPCPDITLKVTGTVTHAAVSSFLSGTVGAVISSSGAAGLVGNINLLGIPVGQAKAFVAVTDAQGNPNPSLCGEVRAVVGPLDLGNVAASFTCDGCVTGVLGDFERLALCLGAPMVQDIATNIAPRLATNSVPLTPEQMLTSLTDIEKMGFLAELMKFPPATLATLPPCFLTAFSNAWDQIQPKLLVCGEVNPKLFGFPLAGKVVQLQAMATKTNFAGLYGFSPSYMIAASIAGITRIYPLALFPPQDDASMGFNVNFPDAGEALIAGLSGQLSSVDQYESYVRNGFDYMLQNATYTMTYKLHPLGVEMLNSQARVILPDLTAHPGRPGSTWLPPELRGTNYISRLDLLLLLLDADVLGNPLWKGTTEDMAQLDARLNGMSLQDDYFPHGGMVGAAKLQFPRALTEQPPDYLPALIDPNSSMDLLTRVQDAMDYAQNYLLSMTNRGSLGFYVPAPNPPFFTNSAGQPLGPKELLEAIQTFDVNTIQDAGITQLYPVELMFLRGWFNASLIGVPIGTGSVVALPPGQGRTNGTLNVTVNGPTTGWLSSFVQNATLNFEMTQAPVQPISQWASNTLTYLAFLTNNPPAGTNATTWAQLRDTAWRDFASGLITNLPKASLVASVNLTMPPPISDVVNASGGFELHAYSPRFDPSFNGTGPAADARRNGGLAFKGNLNFANLVTVNDAELTVIPKPSGLPSLAARLNAPNFGYNGVGLQNIIIDFASDPNPHFSASGGVSPINVGLFNITPLTGGALTGRLDIVRIGPGTNSASLVVSPAQLQLPALFTDTILIHGANRTDPFSFSTGGPWTATIEVSNSLSLGAGGVTLVTLNSSSLLNPITFSGNGTTNGSVTMSIGAGTTLNIFPGKSYAQTLTLAPAATGTLTISSDGTFRLTGNLGADMSLMGIGLPVATVGANASFTLTQNGLTLSGQLGGGALSQAGSTLTASGTVTITRDGVGAVMGSGTINIPPFGNDQFVVEGPTTGANITGTLSSGGLTLSGARFRVLNLMTNTLPAFTIPASGNIGVTIGPFTAQTIEGFQFGNVQFQLGRTNNIWSVTNFNALLTVPNLNKAVSIVGGMASDGTFTWTGTLSSASSLSGTSFTQVGAGASARLTRTRAGSVFTTTLTVTGVLSGGALSGLPFVTTNVGFTVSPAGTIGLNAGLTMTPLTLGIFTISAPGGGNLSVTLTNGGVGVGSGAQLSMSGVVDSTTSAQLMTLQQFNFAPDGSFSVAASSGALTIGGFSFPSTSLQFSRTATNAAPPSLVSLAVAGNLSNAKLPSSSLSGSITNNGSLRLAATNQTGNLAGYPFGNVSMTLTKTAGLAGSIALSGYLNLPGFTAFTFNGTASSGASGTSLAVAATGALTLGGYPLTSGNLNLNSPAVGTTSLTLQGSLNVGGFAPASQTFNGTLDTAGNFSMTNTYNGAFYTFPVLNMTNVLRRGAANYNVVIASDGPLGYWRLGDTSGTIAYENSSPALNGTYQNSPNLLQTGALSGDINR
ncbi:MAG TPA: hypothetical protein VLU94_00315, partial [Candidatus Nitrosotalea sp.]|nr:hypothetical protein [Candidatus Nitrosotalea sp.]